MYREGFEVVLFLQSLRLQVGAFVVLQGVLIGPYLHGYCRGTHVPGPS